MRRCHTGEFVVYVRSFLWQMWKPVDAEPLLASVHVPKAESSTDGKETPSFILRLPLEGDERGAFPMARSACNQEAYICSSSTPPYKAAVYSTPEPILISRMFALYLQLGVPLARCARPRPSPRRGKLQRQLRPRSRGQRPVHRARLDPGGGGVGWRELSIAPPVHPHTFSLERSVFGHAFK